MFNTNPLYQLCWAAFGSSRSSSGSYALRFWERLRVEESAFKRAAEAASRTYVNVIEDAFGAEVDFAQLHKVYRAPRETETRYSPAKCIGCSTKDVSGNPDPKHISTSFVERQNWTVRTTMRRYTRLSNGFSRKMENHAAATALNYFAYNFIKIHRTLRTSPAMAAGVTDRLWSVEDLVALWEAYEQRRAERQVA
jgi:hypothetical protein